MGDLINLNKFRKAKQRRAEDDQAAINREKFGRTKAETKEYRHFAEQQKRALDAQELEPADRKSAEHGAEKDER
jgi:hypothetical protein